MQVIQVCSFTGETAFRLILYVLPFLQLRQLPVFNNTFFSDVGNLERQHSNTSQNKQRSPLFVLQRCDFIVLVLQRKAFVLSTPGVVE